VYYVLAAMSSPPPPPPPDDGEGSDGNNSGTGRPLSYGEAEYWDARYVEEGGAPYDWYQRYDALRPFVRRFAPPASRLLMIGCGSARTHAIPPPPSLPPSLSCSLSLYGSIYRSLPASGNCRTCLLE
jgi:hypothetical protein